MQNFVRSSHCSKVIGKPKSLLNEPAGETVGPAALSMWASKSFVLVLPCDPVMPTTINPVKRLRTNAANADSASKTSSTTMHGPSIR